MKLTETHPEGLIAVDPGKHACAVAWFSASGQLLSLELRVQALPVQADKWRTVCEYPQVYDPRKAKRHVDPKDLVYLTLAAGRMTGGRETEYFLPAEWKGQVPCSCDAKHGPDECTHHRRMLEALSPDETRMLWMCAAQVNPNLQHNLWDAVSLGLTVLGRLTPGPLRGKKLCQ